MRIGFSRIAVLALPVLLAAGCAGDDTDPGIGADATLPAPVDTGMYVPPPVTDTGMVSTDTMGTDTMAPDTAAPETQ